MRSGETRWDPILSLVSIIFVILLIVGAPIAALLSIAYEDVFVKWEIDNPYVDANYSGWKTVSVDGVGRLTIPESWEMYEENGICYIMNESKEIWAIGATYGTGDDRFVDETELVSYALSSLTDQMPVFSDQWICEMRGSYIAPIYFEDGDDIRSFAFLELWGDGISSFSLVIFADMEENHSQFDISEAILYSFVYGV